MVFPFPGLRFELIGPLLLLSSVLGPIAVLLLSAVACPCLVGVSLFLIFPFLYILSAPIPFTQNRSRSPMFPVSCLHRDYTSNSQIFLSPLVYLYRIPRFLFFIEAFGKYRKTQLGPFPHATSHLPFFSSFLRGRDACPPPMISYLMTPPLASSLLASRLAPFQTF